MEEKIYLPRQGDIVFPKVGSMFFAEINNRSKNNTTKLYQKSGRPWMVVSSTAMNKVMNKCWVVPMGRIHPTGPDRTIQLANKVWYINDDANKTLCEIFASEIMTVDNRDLEFGKKSFQTFIIDGVMEKIFFNLGIKVDQEVLAGSEYNSRSNSRANLLITDNEESEPVKEEVKEAPKEELKEEPSSSKTTTPVRKTQVHVNREEVYAAIRNGSCENISAVAKKFSVSKATATRRWNEYQQLAAKEKAKAIELVSEKKVVKEEPEITIRKREYNGPRPNINCPAMLQVPKSTRAITKIAWQYLYHFKYDSVAAFAKYFPGSPKAIQNKYNESIDLLDSYHIAAP